MSNHPRLQLVHSRPESESEELPQTDEELFRRFSAHVARIGFRLLGREDEVDDLVQDVFLVAFKQRDQLRDPYAIKGWLSTIAVRTARRRLRMRRVRNFVGMDTPQAQALPQPGSTPEENALLARVYTLLDQVSVDKRLAWTLRYVEGERLERVAERCGCSLATAKRRIAATHQFLQAELANG